MFTVQISYSYVTFMPDFGSWEVRLRQSYMCAMLQFGRAKMFVMQKQEATSI